MLFNHKLIICIILIYKICDAAHTIPENIITEVGASYTLIIQEEGIEPKECTLSNGIHSYKIDLENQGIIAKPLTKSNDYDNNTNIITSLGNNICGIKLTNWNDLTIKFWEFQLVDTNNEFYEANARVITRDVASQKFDIYADYGDFISFQCGDIYSETEYCQLYNTNSNLIKESYRDCSFSKYVNSVHDYGMWYCYKYDESNMKAHKITYHIQKKENDVISTWSNETNLSANFGCSVKNPTVIPNFCLMVSPSGTQYLLKPGLATEDYTAIGTNFDKELAVCSMQILKPLQYLDKGIWRCEQHIKSVSTNPIGAFIKVPSNVATNPKADIPETITIKENSTLSISCRVPYSINYCYIKSPDNKIYSFNNNKRLATLGLCEYTEPLATMKDNGTWLCGFATNEQTVDSTYKFKVEVIRNETLIAPSSVTVSSLGEAAFICTTRGTLGNYPLKYCKFLSPSGNVYILSDGSSNGRISYEGNGLKNGDCGIRLKNLSHFSDQGVWTCFTKIDRIDKPEELLRNIKLELR